MWEAILLHLGSSCTPLLQAAFPAQVFLTPDYLAIAMEYATDGDMFQLVVRQRGLLEKDARWYFQQLIVAVDYCHRMVSACTSILLLYLSPLLHKT